MAVTTDYANLYVPIREATICPFGIGIDGTLTAKDTLTRTGTPIRMAVNTAGTYLYVISCTPSPTLPCTAGTAALTEYALTSGTIARGFFKALNLAMFSGAYASDNLVPTGITVLANNGTSITGNAVFVTAYDQSAVQSRWNHYQHRQSRLGVWFLPSARAAR